jgi:prepilin-type N-terminal cleavage/methylation domain-containing protein/prepilin-type processing-associated H-X9-DG protein
MNTKHPKSPFRKSSSAFTLIELLVVIVIIGILAALLVPALSKAQQKAADTKLVSNLRSVTQASLNFSAENEGIIPVLRWQGDPALALMPAKNKGYVLSSFWGCTQPYLFSDIALEPANNNAFGNEIRDRLPKLFGMPKESFTKKPNLFGKGYPFGGAMLMGGDWSGIPNPLSFNSNIAKWGELVRLQNVDRIAGTIYITYGWGQFNEADGATYVPTPNNGTKSSSDIYYLPSKRAIASFLDGHVEFLTPAMNPKIFASDDE